MTTTPMIENDDCPICHDDINLPYKLECNHRFCYLCIKRAYESQRSCPYCRRPITQRIYDAAKLQEETLNTITTDIQWLYSGKNFGWWKFDPRTNQHLENIYQSGETNCTIHIMARPYTIDFQAMEQQSADGYSRRKIKRNADTADDTVNNVNTLVKGIAGLRFDDPVIQPVTQSVIQPAAVVNDEETTEDADDEDAANDAAANDAAADDAATDNEDPDNINTPEPK